MANNQSSKKRIRQIASRTLVNRARVSRIRSYVKKVELALLSNDLVAAKLAFITAEPELMRGAQAGVLHKNTAARKVSRLSARINALGDK